mmetsp:Transcript_10880/g.21760  ORF Transcript_10880/g.21760 Transcript_10880/m.21760 type:complete len:82 (-) Transcript_10880:88-333(-)
MDNHTPLPWKSKKWNKGYLYVPDHGRLTKRNNTQLSSKKLTQFSPVPNFLSLVQKSFLEGNRNICGSPTRVFKVRFAHQNS